MRLLIKIGSLIFLILLFFKGSIWYLTDGFSVKEYYTENPSPSSPPQSARTILSQSFSYLNKGSESAIFISEDKQWVIKILRQNRLTPTRIRIPFPPLAKRIQAEIERKKNKRTQLYSSCQIAFNRLSKETELHFLSLEGAKITLDVRDKLNRPHKIDLSKCAFSLQKKASLPYPTLVHYMQQGEVEKAKECLSSIIRVFKERLNRGITDDDPSIKKNIGFIGTRALFLDIGGFRESEECKDPAIQRHQILIALLELKQWLHEHYPILEEHLESLSALI